MRGWSAERVADAAGARVVRAGGAGGPEQAVIGSGEVQPGDLFVGLPGSHVDGGTYASEAIGAGAWGVLVGPAHADAALAAAHEAAARGGAAGGGGAGVGGAAGGGGAGVGGAAVLVAEDPLRALQQLATAWRRELDARVIGITGSTGKTSTKDLLRGMLAPHRRTVATAQNLNTEIGLPLTILGAPAGTEVLVLEMAMRGAGQIAELARIAEPDVGVVVNVGPVHVELLGSVEAIAAAKAELIAGLRPGATAIVPAHEPLLENHLRDDVHTVRFGPGGDVDETDLVGLELGFTSAHMRSNAQAALAAARAIGVTPSGAVEVELSALRGQRTALPSGVTVVDDCYNANPMSVRAALDDLAATASGRRVAVLGDMLELGPEAARHHAAAGAHARSRGVALLVTVGPLAAEMGGDHAVATAAEAAELLPRLLHAGDTVLVKGSRGVGLEVVGRRLGA